MGFIWGNPDKIEGSVPKNQEEKNGYAVVASAPGTTCSAQ